MGKEKHGNLGEDAFVYVDVTLDGANRRSHVVRLDELKRNGHTDCYRTFLLIPKEYKDHAESKVLLSGVRERRQ